MVVGSFGEFVFGVSGAGAPGEGRSAERGVTFNALTQSTRSRLVTHATIEALPIVEFAGLDADRVTLTGVLNERTCGDVDSAVLALRAMQAQNVPRALTRGSRVFGLYLVDSLSVTEERWAADGQLLSASYSLSLIATRGGGANG